MTVGGPPGGRIHGETDDGRTVLVRVAWDEPETRTCQRGTYACCIDHGSYPEPTTCQPW